MDNANFINDFKVLLDKYKITAMTNEEGFFLIDDSRVPILFAPLNK